MVAPSGRLAARALLLSAAVVAHGARAGAANPNAKACIAADEAGIRLADQLRLLEAREQFLACARPGCPGEVRAECGRQVADLNARIPTVVFAAKDGDGNDLTDVKVLMDDKVLAENTTGIALSVDPGEHRFAFERAGQPAVTRTLVLREGEKERRVRVVIGRGTKRDAARSHGAAQKTIGLIVAGAGLVGIGVGTYFGLRASSLWASSQSECSAPSDCPNHDQAVADHDSAERAATISTIAFGAGGVALAAGGVLFFTAPSVGPDHVALRVGGTF